MANNGQFNKSNWTRLVSDPHAAQYLPSAKGGIVNPTTVAGNTVLTTSVTAAFAFKGNGPVEVTFPFGQAFQGTNTGGMSLGETVLQAGASSYASGTHPIIVYKLVNAITATTSATLTASDLIAVQF